MTDLGLVPRPVAGSVDELLEGAERRPFVPADGRSSTQFEHVVLGGERFVLKHVHLDDDFTMRVSGDLGCRPLRVWEAGLTDVAAGVIDAAIVAAARGDGRNGWGAALLLRDVAAELVPVGDDPLPEAQHLAFLDWAYPGEGPVAHELAWYQALDRARLPPGHTKESTVEDLRTALERHGVATAGWWERQVALCLLGAVVQFGWEKALGDDDELAWWCDRARAGARCL